MKARQKKKAGSLIAMEWLGALTACTILVLLVVWFWKERQAFTLDEEGTVFYIGNEFHYSTDTQISYNGDYAYIFDGNNDTALKLTDTPVIMQKGNKMMIPVSMAYNCGEAGMDPKRVNYFSVLVNHKEEVSIGQNRKAISVHKGFLFDGKDLYIFLEPMTLCIGNTSIDLAPLSYAKVIYHSSIEYYNSETNEYKWINVPEGEIEVYSNQGYSVDLGTDVVKSGDEEWILFSSVELLDLLKE